MTKVKHSITVDWDETITAGELAEFLKGVPEDAVIVAGDEYVRSIGYESDTWAGCRVSGGIVVFE